MAGKATTIKEAIKRYEDKTGNQATTAKDVALEFQYPPIEKMDATLASLTACEKLSLSTNMIEKITGIATLRNLKVLSLGRNYIKTFTGLKALSDTLEELWISYNLIEKIKGLNTMKCLRVLHMSNNLVKEWAEFNKLQNWSNVWPGPCTFHPAVVPLPMHQGYMLKKKAPPAAKANAELMKIPNFLHLTPPAIQAHCEAIKKFCREWPKGLETDEACEEHMPLEVISSDYCHGNPSIKNPLSRIVSIRIPISKLPMDEHARDKILRLVDDRYDEASGYLTIVADRCPTKKQNLDYATYLLTAVYNEAWIFEHWESEKNRSDTEVYKWNEEPSKKSIANWSQLSVENPTAVIDEAFLEKITADSVHGGKEYVAAIEGVMNIGENEYQLAAYKEAVLKMFGLRKTEPNMGLDDLNQ